MKIHRVFRKTSFSMKLLCESIKRSELRCPTSTLRYFHMQLMKQKQLISPTRIINILKISLIITVQRVMVDKKILISSNIKRNSSHTYSYSIYIAFHNNKWHVDIKQYFGHGNQTNRNNSMDFRRVRLYIHRNMLIQEMFLTHAMVITKDGFVAHFINGLPRLFL